jgi:hypothetical protein
MASRAHLSYGFHRRLEHQRWARVAVGARGVVDRAGRLPSHSGRCDIHLDPWATEIGYSQSNHTAALMAGMAGLRLHPPTQTVQVYADALVGVGHLSNPKGAPIYEGSYSGQGKETNGAMSFGGGMRFVTGRAALFADAHYDYYFLDLGTPIIPIRMGLSYQ